jgi:hypothetical protein
MVKDGVVYAKIFVVSDDAPDWHIPVSLLA